MRDTSVLRAALGCISFVSLFRLPPQPPVSCLQESIYAGYGNIFVADFNGDGKLDILVSDGTTHRTSATVTDRYARDRQKPPGTKPHYYRAGRFRGRPI
jgi:hypothetical protein